MKIKEFSTRMISLIVGSVVTLLVTLIIANNVDLETFGMFSYCTAISYSLSNVLKSRHFINSFRNNSNSNFYDYFKIIKLRCLIYLIPFSIFQFCALTYFEVQTKEKLIWCFYSNSILLFDLYLNALIFSQNSKATLAINILIFASIIIFGFNEHNTSDGSNKLKVIVFWTTIMSIINLYCYFLSFFKDKSSKQKNDTGSRMTIESIVGQSIYTLFIFGLVGISQYSYGLTRISYVFISSVPFLFLSAYSQNIIKKYSYNYINTLYIAKDTLRLLFVIFLNLCILMSCRNIIEDYFKYSLNEIFQYALGAIFFIFSVLYQQISFYINEKNSNIYYFSFMRLILYVVSYIMPLSIIYSYGFKYYNFASFLGLCFNISFLIFSLKKKVHE